MQNLFGVISLLLFVAVIVGLIRPRWVIHWGKKRGRLRVLLYYIPALLVTLIVTGATAPPPTPAELAAQQVAAQKQAEQKAAAQQAAAEKATAEKAAAQQAAAEKAAAEKATAQQAAAKKAAEEAAAQQTAKVAEAAYKAGAQTIAWSALARNPDQYKGQVFTFTGEVVTTIPDGQGDNGEIVQLIVDPDGMGGYIGNDNVAVDWVPTSLGSNRILANDVITIYGQFTGLQKMKLVDGSTQEWPAITAKYIDDKGQLTN